MMSYRKSYEQIKSGQVDLGIQTSVKTQGGRKHSSAAAENKGADPTHVDRHGHWGQGSRSGAYFPNVIPWDVIRALAGCDVESGSYFILRNILLPDNALQSQVFPLLSQAKQQVAQSVDGINRVSEIAGKRFLLLLENLCIIILQDAAVLVREPLNALFQHPLFQTATFKEYTIKLHAAIELRGPEQRGALQQCIPHIASSLHRIEVNTLTNGQGLIRLEHALHFAGNALAALPIASTNVGVVGSLPVTDSMNNNRRGADNTDDGGDTAAGYKMNRSISSVKDAWDEYEKIKRLDSVDDKWKGPLSSAEGKFYSRRRRWI